MVLGIIICVIWTWWKMDAVIAVLKDILKEIKKE